jgi:hypothetical protein
MRIRESLQTGGFSERVRTGANACHESTSWGSLVRAQYRPLTAENPLALRARIAIFGGTSRYQRRRAKPTSAIGTRWFESCSVHCFFVNVATFSLQSEVCAIPFGARGRANNSRKALERLKCPVTPIACRAQATTSSDGAGDASVILDLRCSSAVCAA